MAKKVADDVKRDAEEQKIKKNKKINTPYGKDFRLRR